MGCDHADHHRDRDQTISIHASRMGCDQSRQKRHVQHCYFNPRIPYGMRLTFSKPYATSSLFQSTHPVWDATSRSTVTSLTILNFNPRIPYGMRRQLGLFAGGPLISIHASRMGCDLGCDRTWESLLFQSTHPVWDATASDRHHRTPDRDFNPRIPYGMRPVILYSGMYSL